MRFLQSLEQAEGMEKNTPATNPDKNAAGGVIFLLKATFDDPHAERPRPTRFNMKSTRTVGEVATWVRKNIGPTMWNKWDVVLVGIIDYDKWDDRNATIEPVAAQLPIGRVWTPGSCLVFATEPPMLIGLQPRSPTSTILSNKSLEGDDMNPFLRMQQMLAPSCSAPSCLLEPPKCLSCLPGLED